MSLSKWSICGQKFVALHCNKCDTIETSETHGMMKWRQFLKSQGWSTRIIKGLKHDHCPECTDSNSD